MLADALGAIAATLFYFVLHWSSLPIRSAPVF
jgi:hypothetical protein